MTGPVLRVVRGDATEEDVAALLTVLVLRRAAGPEPPRTASTWADRAAGLRGRPVDGPGPDGWRAAFRPR